MKKLFFVMLGLICFLGIGCSSDDADDGDSAVEGEKAAENEKVSVTGNEYSFELPDTVTGGFVDLEFKNEGKLVHEAAFVKVDPEMPLDQFIKDLKIASSEEGGVIADYLKPFAAGFFTKGGETETIAQAIPGGTYYVVCTYTDFDSVEDENAEEPATPLPQHFELGMIKKVTVDGPEKVEFPDVATVVTGKEYSFDVTGFKAGKNEILFKNDGPEQIHMAAVMEFPEGVDEAAATKALEAFASDGPPPEGTPEPEDVGFAGVIDVGGGAMFNVEAKAGRVYAFACFFPDRAGGPPHLTKGMSKVVTVQ